MSPRKYDMSKRAAAAEATRERIVLATIAQHDEKGILGTSFDDIARAADLAPGTVRRHFPTVDDLVMACGRHVWVDLRLPELGHLDDLFAGARSRNARLERLVDALCASYELGEHRLAEAERRAGEVAALQGFLAQLGEYRERLVRATLARNPPAPLVQTVSGLIAFPTWKSMRDAGLSPEATRRALRRVVTCAASGH
jgi:AcrR family transcriptional regulator